MSTFAVIYTYVDDQDLRAALRTQHRAYLAELGEQGIGLIAGAWAPGEEPGALLVFKADTKDEVADIVARDPFVTGGYVTGSTIIGWSAGIGPLADYFQ